MVLVEFTKMLFNYLEKKKLKAWNQEVGHCHYLHLCHPRYHFYHPYLHL